MVIYMLCMALFLVGVYCVIRKRNIIKIIIGIGIMDYAVNLFIILLGYRAQGRAPIYSENHAIKNMVDPIPQTMALVSIAVGLAVMLLLVSIAIRIYEKYKTFDITKIDRLKG